MSLEGTVMTFSLLLADLSAPPSTDVSLALSTPDGVVVDCGSGVTLNLMQERIKLLKRDKTIKETNNGQLLTNVITWFSVPW